ncbi:MAG: 4Fe-4S dicluster domain-containing protein [Prevotella sp.]|nr:4Fe-4S dicluster domain-containing protein [Prevotella sp.]
MLKTIRITLAAVMFIGITLLLLDFTGTLHHWLGWMAKVQFLPALMALNAVVVAGLILLTLLFGRIYCSVICPLGIMQDLFGWLGKRAKKNRYTYSAEKRWLRYGMLAVFIAAAVAGVSVVFRLLAPYSAYGRIVSSLLQPVYLWGNNLLASLAEHYDSYAFYQADVWLKSLSVLVIAAVTLVVLAVLAWRNGRTYCNTICPVGTILSFFARFSLVKIRFDADKCRNCSLCTKNCKGACIDYKNHRVDYSRCIVCGDCLQSCHFGALRYGAPSKPPRGEAFSNSASPSREAGSVTSRRSFLLSTALLTTAALAQEAKKVDGGLAEIADKAIPKRQTPLTPPGSLSAQNMAHHCTGCQLCIAACPNGVLRPSSDLMSLMQPVMSYERGYCRPECNRCSEVCPAGAIRPIERETKASTQIGHAVWVKKNCIPLVDGVSCGNCARHCPTEAIEMVPSDPNDDESVKIPVVNEARCIGCGSCEHLCPARPFTAIYVEGHEVHKEI